MSEVAELQGYDNPWIEKKVELKGFERVAVYWDALYSDYLPMLMTVRIWGIFSRS